MDKINLEELEQLAAQATPGPWEVDMLFNIVDEHGILVHAFEEYGHTTSPSRANIRHIVAACNSLPKLIAENRALQERVRELERQRDWLATFIEDNMDCEMCPYFETVCTPQAPVDCAEWITKAAKDGISNVQ
jgi:hypothetical protein